MPATFVHVSDIHFGQERDSEFVVHDDVRECLIKDAKLLSEKYADGHVTGIIVTGDIAYGGKSEEYAEAGKWLDRLAEAVGCAKTSVQLVPGNHDIDRSAISSGCRFMIEQILQLGEPKLDEFLADERDREVLYGRFSAYRPFAEAYNCPMDTFGGLSRDRTVELASGRKLRFVGINSALICSDEKKEEGVLLLGNRQRVLPRNDGEELVVLLHHPLHWLRDSAKAQRYVRSRARVLISGHEHNPNLDVKNIRAGTDLMMLAAGATVPPNTNDKFTYTYNLLIFDWDEKSDSLKVTVVPRAWSEEDTDFEDDDKRLNGHKPTVELGCPNFRRAPKPVRSPVRLDGGNLTETGEGEPIAATPVVKVYEGKQMSQSFAMVLLRFFRDLTASQRVAVLVDLNALPPTWRDPLTHSIERTVIDGLEKAGRISELEAAIDAILGTTSQGKGDAN